MMPHIPALNELFCYVDISDTTKMISDQVIGGKTPDIALSHAARLTGRRSDYMHLPEDSAHSSYTANAESLRRFSSCQSEVFAVAHRLREEAIAQGATDGSLGLLRDVLAGLTAWPSFQTNRAEAPQSRTGALERWEIALKVYGLGTSKTVAEMMPLLELLGLGNHEHTFIQPKRLYDLVDQAELLLSTVGPRVCPFTEKMFRDLFSWVLQGPEIYYQHMARTISPESVEKFKERINLANATIESKADPSVLRAILQLGSALTKMREVLPLLEYSARPLELVLNQWQKAQAVALDALGYGSDAVPDKPGLYYYSRRTTALKEYVQGGCRPEPHNRHHDFGPMKLLWEKALEGGEDALQQIAPVIEFFALDAPSTIAKLEDYLTHLERHGADVFSDQALPAFTALQWERY